MFSVAVKGPDRAGGLIALDSGWHGATGVCKWSDECSVLRSDPAVPWRVGDFQRRGITTHSV